MTWPPVFDGIGALTVDSGSFDPDALADRIPGLTWIAQKVGGTDCGTAQAANAVKWRARGLKVGAWVYCSGPPAEDVKTALTSLSWAAAFLIFDVEAEYKADDGGHYEWAAELVAAAPKANIAVTSYGAIPGWGNQPSTVDYKAFADAGWPMLAQAYDGYTVPEARTYTTTSGQKFPGPYLASGVHTMVRSLALVTGQAVYRPESIDG